MNWPVMWRSTHEAFRAVYKEELVQANYGASVARGEAKRERDLRLDAEGRLAQILDKLVQQASAELDRKVAESKIYEQVITEMPAVEPLESQILQTIRQRAMRGTPEWRILETEARRLRKQGSTVEDVVKGILEGEAVEW